MSGQIHGHITSVAIDYDQAILTVAAALGDTVLHVDDVADFAREGGYLGVQAADGTYGSPLAYGSIDNDASTITLASPLAAAIAANSILRVMSASGVPVLEYVATVVDDSDGSDIDAPLAHSLIPLVAANIRTVDNESCVVTSDASGHWTVTDILGESAASSGGAGAARTTSATTSASVAGLGTATVTFSLAVSYRLLSMTVNRAARVRLYATATGAAADLSRSAVTDPLDGLGCILEYVAATAGTYLLSPLVDGSSMEATPSTTITGVIDNPDPSTQTITVSFVYQPTE